MRIFVAYISPVFATAYMLPLSPQLTAVPKRTAQSEAVDGKRKNTTSAHTSEHLQQYASQFSTEDGRYNHILSSFMCDRFRERKN